jgi:hypothetical protein
MQAPPARIGKYAGGQMPSKSKAQKRLMQAAAHTPGGYGGVPQVVGKEFAAADKKAGKRKLPARKQPLHRGLINR